MKIFLTRSIAAVFAIFVVASCQNQAQEQPEVADPAVTESSDRETALASTIDALEEVWNSGNYDRLAAILAADFRRQGPDESFEGVQAMQEFMDRVRTTYSDFNIEFTEKAYGEDFAFVRWMVTGTYPADDSAAASGRSIDVSGITLLRFDDGMITDEIVYYDTATLQAQLDSEGIPHAE